jgi:hypothetical protein
MNEITSARVAYKAVMEVLTAFVDENENGGGHALSNQLLMSYAPDPLPVEMRNFALLAGQAFAVLAISVQAQAVFASAARGQTVSVNDILASLGSSIEQST